MAAKKKATPKAKSRTKRGVKLAPADHGDVLRSGNQGLKPGHVEIEILVVQMPHQALGHDELEFRDIEDESRLRIDLTFDRHIEVIVMPVKVRAVAQTEDALVLRLAPARVMETVGGVEMYATCYHATRHS